MNFKLFWKKTNRGLWLGLALLVGLLVFIIVSEVSFGLQKKEIRALSKEFVEDLLAVNVIESDLGEDGYLTEEQKAAQKAELDEIAKKYWYTGSVELNSSNYDLAELSELLNKWQREVAGKVTKLDYKIDQWEIDITRDGPGRVLLTLTTDEIKVSGEGAAPKGGSGEGVLFPTPVSERGFAEDIEQNTGLDTDEDVAGPDNDEEVTDPTENEKPAPEGNEGDAEMTEEESEQNTGLDTDEDIAGPDNDEEVTDPTENEKPAPEGNEGDAEMTEEESSGGWQCTCKVYFSLELIRHGGRWQIAGMNANTGYGYSYYYGLLGMVS